MKKNRQKTLASGVVFLAAFALWTTVTCYVDVQPIGPHGSSVGVAKLNGYVHRLTGVHMSLYVLTDWLSLIPLLSVFSFALLGLVQLIRRRSIFRVDSSILLLGLFYLVVIAVYAAFEVFIVNYRPVLIDGYMEASYPSSTTMLVLCVMSGTLIQLRIRAKNALLKRCACVAILVFMVVMVLCRLISGVHWFSDILGGILLSTGLVMIYSSLVCYHKDENA